VLEQPVQRHITAGLPGGNLEHGCRFLSQVWFRVMIAHTFQFSAFGDTQHQLQRPRHDVHLRRPLYQI
jgi:hypothetical protein